MPLVYAFGMATAAVGALATGWAYDRLGGARTLFILPVLVSAVPALVFSSALARVLVGVAIWGFAVGLQDSTVKAYVADLVPQARLAGAYGVFAAIQGAAAIIGGTAAGYLYEQSLPLLVGLVVAVQAGAVVLLVVVRRQSRVSVV